MNSRKLNQHASQPATLSPQGTTNHTHKSNKSSSSQPTGTKRFNIFQGPPTPPNHTNPRTPTISYAEAVTSPATPSQKTYRVPPLQKDLTNLNTVHSIQPIPPTGTPHINTHVQVTENETTKNPTTESTVQTEPINTTTHSTQTSNNTTTSSAVQTTSFPANRH